MPPRTFAAGTFPETVAVADFTGDGKQDIAVTNNVEAGTISILRGTGTGRFRAPVSYAAGEFPKGLAVADLDGDGDQDVAVANSGPYTLRVLLNAGNGTFSAPVDYSAGGYGAAVVIADLNNDTHPDIALTNGQANFGSVWVLLNNGDGNFQAAASYTVGKGVYSLTTADFNGDGFRDLACTNQTSGVISVLRNTGAGTFHAPNDYYAGNTPRAIAADDLDDDGDIDLAVVSANNPGMATVLLNDGAWPAPIPPLLDPDAEMKGRLIFSSIDFMHRASAYDVAGADGIQLPSAPVKNRIRRLSTLVVQNEGVLSDDSQEFGEADFARPRTS
jgi:hypothetical protein